MIIGYMRNFKNPTFMVNVLSLTAKAKGIDLLYFRAEDINMEKNKINGLLFEDNEWKNYETDIPKIIDTNTLCLKHKKAIQYLKEHAYLTENGERTFKRRSYMEKLSNKESFNSLIIPTKEYTSFSALKAYLSLYNEIVLKPSASKKGAGIYRVSKNDAGKYIIGYEKQQQVVSIDELQEFCERNIKDKKYLVQQFIKSQTVHGDPFNCRTHLEKNEQGKWEVAKKHVRIGIGQQVVSNLKKDSAINDGDVFVKAHFTENGKEICKRLDKMATEIANEIEKIRRTNIATISFDFGIDRDENIFLFDINGSPDTSRLIAQASVYRSNYYKYLTENIL